MLGISLLTLTPGHVGGSETYARQLVAALARRGYAFEAVAPAAVGELAGAATVVADEVRIPGDPLRRIAGIARVAADPRTRRRYDRYAAVHFPLTVELPRLRRPTVVTLHDLQHLDLPQLFGRAERVYRAVAYHGSLRRADRVVAISAFVRERAVALLGLDPDHVRVVHSGVDHERLRPDPTVAREPFLLYPARPWPHKNHARLYEAFAELRRERPELRLVLTGGGDFGPVPAGVELRGLVPEEELVSLYRRAAALVFPSLYEGFGQPPLEAMACGCPVACSDAAALPEIVGGAARLFDPDRPAEIAAAVREVLDDPDPWRQRGLERAAAFSWDATAAGHEAVYADVV